MFNVLSLLDVPDLQTSDLLQAVRAARGRVGARATRSARGVPQQARAPAAGRAGGGRRARAVRACGHRGAAPDRPRAARRGRAQHVADRRAGGCRRARHPHRRGCGRARARGDRRDQPQGADADPVACSGCSATRTTDPAAAARRRRSTTSAPWSRRARRPGSRSQLTVDGTRRPLDPGCRADRLPDRAGVADQRAQSLRRRRGRRCASPTATDGVDIEVRDSGTGDASGRPRPLESGRHGLLGLRERTRLLGGDLELRPGRRRAASGWRPTSRRRRWRPRDQGRGRRRPGAGAVRVRRPPRPRRPTSRSSGEAGDGGEALGAVPSYDAGRGADGRPDAPDGRARGDPADHGRPAVRRRRGSWSSPPSTTTSWCTRPCARAPAASCSRTPGRPSCSRRSHVVAAGDALLAPSVTRRLIEQFAALPGRPRHPRDDGLTDREREVLVEVAARPVQPGDRRPPAHGLRDGEDPRQPPAHQARLPRPGPAGDARLRVRA